MYRQLIYICRDVWVAGVSKIGDYNQALSCIKISNWSPAHQSVDVVLNTPVLYSSLQNQILWIISPVYWYLYWSLKSATRYVYHHLLQIKISRYCGSYHQPLLTPLFCVRWFHTKAIKRTVNQFNSVVCKAGVNNVSDYVGDYNQARSYIKVSNLRTVWV